MKCYSFVVLLLPMFASAQMKAPQNPPQYVVTSHVAVPEHNLEMAADVYAIQFGSVILKVRYSESQTSSWPLDQPWRVEDGIASYLHYHSRANQSTDLSQVPQIGGKTNACVMSGRDHVGDPVIAVQPTDAPCFSNNGRTLHYLPTPNGKGPNAFAYVNFDILSERQVGTR